MFSKFRQPTLSLLSLGRSIGVRNVLKISPKMTTNSMTMNSIRSLSTTPEQPQPSSQEQPKKESTEVVKLDYDEYDDDYEPKTAKEKVLFIIIRTLPPQPPLTSSVDFLLSYWSIGCLLGYSRYKIADSYVDCRRCSLDSQRADLGSKPTRSVLCCLRPHPLQRCGRSSFLV